MGVNFHSFTIKEDSSHFQTRNPSSKRTHEYQSLTSKALDILNIPASQKAPSQKVYYVNKKNLQAWKNENGIQQAAQKLENFISKILEKIMHLLFGKKSEAQTPEASVDRPQGKETTPANEKRQPKPANAAQEPQVAERAPERKTVQPQWTRARAHPTKINPSPIANHPQRKEAAQPDQNKVRPNPANAAPSPAATNRMQRKETARPDHAKVRPNPANAAPSPAATNRMQRKEAAQPNQISPIPQGKFGDIEYVAFYKNGPTAVFGNFYECPNGIEIWGKKFKCAEAAFQWKKLHDANVSNKRMNEFFTASGEQAFRLSRTIGTNDEGKAVFPRGWHRDRTKANGEGKKDAVMREILEAKFSQNPALKKQLLSTGSANLIESNETTTRDSYWSNNKDGTGKNKLGLYLMDIRDKEKKPEEKPKLLTDQQKIDLASHINSRPWIKSIY